MLQQMVQYIKLQTQQNKNLCQFSRQLPIAQISFVIFPLYQLKNLLNKPDQIDFYIIRNDRNILIYICQLNAKELSFYKQNIFSKASANNKNKMSSIINRSLRIRDILNMREPSFIIMAFLDVQDLQNLSESLINGQFKELNQQSDYCLRLLSAFVWNKKHMTKVDRTMFYFMYEQKIASEIDKNSILNVAQNFTQQTNTIMKNFNNLFDKIHSATKMSQTQISCFDKIITEPDLPLPVSIRSNVGKYCNSTFQLFICSKVSRGDLGLLEEETSFEEFKNYISSNEENYLKTLLTNTSGTNESLSSVRARVKQIYLNPCGRKCDHLKVELEGEIIEGNQIYNFINLAIKLTKNMINSIKLQIQSLSSDPYAQFVELLLRYSIYKSYVLQFQEQLGSIFFQYQDMIQDLLNINFSKTSGNDFSAWKILMGVFSQQMQSYLKQKMPVYVNLAHKLKRQQNSQFYSNTNLRQVCNFIPQLENSEGSPVLEYLLNEQSIDNLQVLLSDFVQMFVDMSVDQNNVLWCGHSDQSLRASYQIFEQALIAYESDIFRHLVNSSQTLQQQTEAQFKFLQETLNIKPRTLKNLFQQININLVNKLNFDTIDKQLTYINSKYCKNQQPFDMFGSQKTAKSAVTADSDREISDIDLDDLEYISQMSAQEIYQQIDF